MVFGFLRNIERETNELLRSAAFCKVFYLVNIWEIVWKHRNLGQRWFCIRAGNFKREQEPNTKCPRLEMAPKSLVGLCINWNFVHFFPLIPRLNSGFTACTLRIWMHSPWKQRGKSNLNQMQFRLSCGRRNFIQFQSKSKSLKGPYKRYLHSFPFFLRPFVREAASPIWYLILALRQNAPKCAIFFCNPVSSSSSTSTRRAHSNTIMLSSDSSIYTPTLLSFSSHPTSVPSSPPRDRKPPIKRSRTRGSLVDAKYEDGNGI